ncbi:hypothetical protein [Nonomuraea sp. B19D2]|uniref:hypothetical protein n=1 Tax=Nonomuraea sp. B19D2 TaxID=3159561 RepID=UPI0032DA47C3
MTPIVHSLAPTNHTGGRVYLRMLQQLTSEEITWRTVPDFKRADQTRRWPSAAWTRPNAEPNTICHVTAYWSTPAKRYRALPVKPNDCAMRRCEFEWR